MFFACRATSNLAWVLVCLIVLSACSEDDSDAVTDEFPVVYVKRPLDSLSDPREPFGFSPGGNLYIRALSSPSAKETNITADLTAEILDEDGEVIKTAGDVADPEVSYDGKKIVFALHKGMDPNLDDDEQINTWDIYEYIVKPENETQLANRLRKVINSLDASRFNEVEPHYLPDGRIVFVSDMQTGTKAREFTLSQNNLGTLDEERRNLAAVLHTVNADGSNVEQISFNQSHDKNPTVLNDGRILFSRWERVGNRNQFTLYTVNPDGSNLDVYYGAHSHDPANSAEVFLYPRETQDGRILATLMPRNGTFLGGDMVYINAANYAEIDVPRQGASTSRPAQDSATGDSVPRDTSVAVNGRYTTPYPLWDNTGRILVSWAECQMTEADDEIPDEDRNYFECNDTTAADDTLVQADPRYRVGMYTPSTGVNRPIADPGPGFVITDPIAVLARELPPQIIPAPRQASDVYDPVLAERNAGVVHVRSVYDMDNRRYTGPPRLIETFGGADVERLPCRAPVSGSEAQFPQVYNSVNCDSLGNDDVQQVDIEVLADPSQTSASKRPARFVRIMKASPTFRSATERADNNLIGPGAYEMRQILGYNEVEPDGSLYVEVPANVPFSIGVLDQYGRQFAAHDGWLQLKAGEIRECHGCHEYKDGRETVNPGYSGASPGAFPNTSGLIVAQPGETMAEARARQSCSGDSCNYQLLKRDLIFTDVWTDPSFRALDPDITIAYDSSAPIMPQNVSIPLTELPYPSNPNDCDNTNDNWVYGGERVCRIEISYEQHIQPIWERDRTIDLADGNGPQIMKCITCHDDERTVDLGAGPELVTQIPAGQLYLTRDDVNANNERLETYNRMFGSRIVQDLDVDNNLVRVQATDADGNLLFEDEEMTIPIFESRGVALANRNIATARNSVLLWRLTGAPTFFNVNNYTPDSYTAPGGQVLVHDGSNGTAPFLTPTEIRLIIEWLDSGGKYNNDPSAVMVEN